MAAVVRPRFAQAPCSLLSVVFRGKAPLSLFNLKPEIDPEARLRGKKKLLLSEATHFMCRLVHSVLVLSALNELKVTQRY